MKLTMKQKLGRLAMGTVASACVAAVAVVTSLHYERAGQAATEQAIAALRPAHALMPTTTGSVVGVYVSGEPHSIKPLYQFEQRTATKLQEVVYYSGWRESFKTAFASAVYRMGAVTMVQIEPDTVSLSAIADGSQDGYLVSYADEVREFGKPVIASFGHEMNGNWYPWGYGHVTPSTFIAAWRHVVTVFRQQGAGNVTWLWTVNAIADRPSQISHPALWWPGSDYVTWVGLDGYFFAAGETFTGVFGQTISEVRALTHKPVLISETGASPASGQAAMITDLFRGVIANGLLGVVLFDAPGRADWLIDNDPAAITAFGTAARDYAHDGRAS
jgi:hypothetical protein